MEQAKEVVMQEAMEVMVDAVASKVEKKMGMMLVGDQVAAVAV